VVTFMIVFAGR
jgi:hypothetical protein